MLNKRKADIAAAVWAAAARVGRNPGLIASEIILDLFPRTMVEAEFEGADVILRAGFVVEVKRIIGAPADEAEQRSFDEIDPSFQPITSRLKRASYFVESLNEHVPLPRLIKEPALLDDARKLMRRKGMECLAEAETLDQLFHAVVGDAA